MQRLKELFEYIVARQIHHIHCKVNFVCVCVSLIHHTPPIFARMSASVLELIQSPTQWVSQVLFPEQKQTENEAYYAFPSNAKVKNALGGGVWNMVIWSSVLMEKL